jgi:hypothetical protein
MEVALSLSFERRIDVGMVAFCASTSISMSFFYFVMPAVLRKTGHSAEIIGAVALVYLPYALRVVWAPLVDRYAGGSAERYRLIAFTMLIASILAILALAAVDPAHDLGATFAIATLIFTLLATGLTALDGYVLSTLAPAVRPRVIPFQVGGMMAGGMLLGLGSLAADGLSWTTTVLLLAGTTAVLAMPLLVLPRVTIPLAAVEGPGIPGGLWRFLKRAVVRRRMAVSVLAHGGLGLPAGYLAVLQIDAGLTPGQVGLFGAVGANMSGLLAAVIAGWLVARFGGWRTLAAVAVTGALIYAAVAFTYAEMMGPSFAVSVALVVMALGYGFFVSFRSLVLAICDAENGATQAAFLSCFDVVVSLLCSSIAGVVAAAIGVSGLFAASAAACVAGAVLAVWALGRPFDSSSIDPIKAPT